MCDACMPPLCIVRGLGPTLPSPKPRRQRTPPLEEVRPDIGDCAHRDRSAGARAQLPPDLAAQRHYSTAADAVVHSQCSLPLDEFALWRLRHQKVFNRLNSACSRFKLGLSSVRTGLL